MTCAWRQAGAVVRYLSFLAHPALLGVLDCALKKQNKNQSCLKMHFKQKQELVYLKVLQGLRYNYIFRTVCTDPFSLLRFWLSFFWGLFGFGFFCLVFCVFWPVTPICSRFEVRWSTLHASCLATACMLTYCIALQCNACIKDVYESNRFYFQP